MSQSGEYYLSLLRKYLMARVTNTRQIASGFRASKPIIPERWEYVVRSLNYETQYITITTEIFEDCVYANQLCESAHEVYLDWVFSLTDIKHIKLVSKRKLL